VHRRGRARAPAALDPARRGVGVGVLVAGVGVVIVIDLCGSGWQFARDPDALALAIDALGKARIALHAIGAERRELMFDAQRHQRRGGRLVSSVDGGRGERQRQDQEAAQKAGQAHRQYLQAENKTQKSACRPMQACA
jgi:hypothetical protein